MVLIPGRYSHRDQYVETYHRVDEAFRILPQFGSRYFRVHVIHGVLLV